MRKLSVIFLFVFLHSFLCYSQKKETFSQQYKTIDSLIAIINSDIDDTSRIFHLGRVFQLYRQTGDVGSAICYGKKAEFQCNMLLQVEKDKKIIARIKKYKADLHNSIGIVYFYDSYYDDALKNYMLSLKLRVELKDVFGEANSLLNIGYVYFDKSNYHEALRYFNASLVAFKSIPDSLGMADAYHNIGYVFYALGNYPEALNNYLNSLRIYELIGNKEGMSNSYNNIGMLYDEQNNIEEAIRNYRESLKIGMELNNKYGIAGAYNNIGLLYKKQGDLQSALENHTEALNIFKTINSKEGISSAYNNIGLVYYEKGIYDEALKNYWESLNIKIAAGDKVGIASTYGNLGRVYMKQSNYIDAERFLIKTRDLAFEIGYKEYLKIAYKDLSELYRTQGKYKGAYENYKLFVLYQDSIDNEETRKKTIQTQMTYDFEKKEAVAKAEYEKELKSQKMLSDERNRKQNIIITFTIIGLLIVVIFSGFIFRSLKITRKQKNIIEKQKLEVEEKNVQLNQQNEEILTQRDEIEAQKTEIIAQRDLVTLQKDHIEEIHKEVTSSINYAKRIQEAVLPSSEESRRFLGEHFVLFMPKDIVSGDFYWTTRINKWLIVAVADCTGHGVPGAFMSMLGISFLNEIVQKQEIHNAGQILNYLRDEIIHALQQKGTQGEQKDGMDISLLVINIETKEAQWAGANNPLYIVKPPVSLSQHPETIEEVVEDKGVSHTEQPVLSEAEGSQSVTPSIVELKGDKMPIAIYPMMKDFVNHEFTLFPGDSVYLFTDGFADQFGGTSGRKFMYKQFKEILVEIHEKPMTEQKAILESVFVKWKNVYEQIDDVTVLGIRI